MTNSERVKVRIETDSRTVALSVASLRTALYRSPAVRGEPKLQAAELEIDAAAVASLTSEPGFSVTIVE